MAEERKEVIVERDREPRSNVGTIVAVIVGAVLVILLLMYGLPFLSGSNNSTTNVDVQAPSPSTGSTGTGSN